MKTLIATFFLVVSLSVFSQKNVYLELSQEQKYCGGAKPSPEILARYEKPLPYINKKLILVSANGKTDSVKTNSKGILKIKLKPGSYKLYEPWRYHKKTPDGNDISYFDLECLTQQWEKVDITIDTKKKKQNIIIDLDPVFCPHEIPCIKNPNLPE